MSLARGGLRMPRTRATTSVSAGGEMVNRPLEREGSARGGLELWEVTETVGRKALWLPNCWALLSSTCWSIPR